MQTAKVTTTVKMLKDGEPDVVNVEEFQFENEAALIQFQMSRILEIYVQGGLLEVKSPTEVEATPTGAIAKINVKSEVQLISLDGNVDKAAQEADRKKMADALMRAPLNSKRPV